MEFAAKVVLATVTLRGGTFGKKRHRRPELSDRSSVAAGQATPSLFWPGTTDHHPTPLFSKRLPKMKFFNLLGITPTSGSLSVP